LGKKPRGPTETILVNRDGYTVVTEKRVVDIELVKKIAFAKQLGYEGKCPMESCEPRCDYNQAKMKVTETDQQPVRLLPLVLKVET
jgi:hypothetical protein